jgi:pimeloyl-ACP methyl ester carboxylesterase
MFSPSAAPERVDAFAATMAGIRRRGFRVMARASAEADLRDGLGGVDVPTLLLYGDADVRAPVAVGEALQAAIPGARLVVLPGVGHASPVEAPELVTAELRAFLRRAGRRAAGRP